MLGFMSWKSSVSAIALVVGAFTAGVFCDRALWSTPPPPAMSSTSPQSLAEKSDPVPAGVARTVVSALPEPSRTGPGAGPSSLAASAQIPGKNHVEPAKNDSHPRENEDRLLDLIQDPFPTGKQAKNYPKFDGSYATKETAADGATVSRSYNSNGTLTGESWQETDGDTVIRTYYDSGSIKGFNDKKADGSGTIILFTQSGLYKSRTDVLADGTRINTMYDDAGQVLERWETGKDGKPVRIQ
jgi:hypothetical protein